MKLDDAICGRRSVREYTDEILTKEQIEAVLEAGTWAPTGMNRQPWNFVVVEDRKLIKYISDQTKSIAAESFPSFAKQFRTEEDVICYNAPALIVICTKKDKQMENLNMCDSILAAQNMFLKAHELGLGTCYMGFVALLGSKPEVLEKIGITADYNMMVPLIMGHPKTKPDRGKREKPKILNWIKQQ
jgi:nitroreductase